MTAHLRRFLQRLFTLFGSDRAERELHREVAAHLALLEDEYQRRGMTPENARRAARLANRRRRSSERTASRRAVVSVAGAVDRARHWSTSD